MTALCHSIGLPMLNSCLIGRCFVAAGSLWLAGLAAAATPESEELLRKGNEAFRRDRAAAIALFTQAIAADPSNIVAYYNRGRVHETEGRRGEALEDFNHILKLQPNHTNTLQLRGSLLLRLGKFAAALEDFDHHIKLVPEHRPHHWMRGMALYYLGRFADAEKQFAEAHRINSDDVEHAIWHFLSVARVSGMEKARASLLKVESDDRVPMLPLYSFYAGKGKPEDVLAAVEAGAPPFKEVTSRLIYAHYYMGLYYEAAGDETRAREHLGKAAALPGTLLSDLARLQMEKNSTGGSGRN
jgi:lipoprotein NlpI